MYFIPPNQQKFDYQYVNALPDHQLDKLIGFYKSPEGYEYQVTWNAKSGLQLNYFHEIRDSLMQKFLNPISENQFDSDGNPKTAEVNFEISESGKTSLSFEHNGRKVQTTRQDSLYYDQAEISYKNDTTHLKALLLHPFSGKKELTIVMIHGSGFSDRNNFWYMYQADFLAKRGYTVLLPDKRGSGKSNGTWHDESFETFSGDILASINYLKRNHTELPQVYVVMGLSQGGWISHIVANKSEDIKYIVDVVSSAVSPNEQVLHEVKNDIKNSGIPNFLVSILAPIFTKRAKEKRKKWWSYNGNYNPIDMMQSSEKKILKIYGEDDEGENVPVQESLTALNELVSEHKKSNISIKVFKGSGHGLFHPSTKWIRSDYLDHIDNWLQENSYH